MNQICPLCGGTYCVSHGNSDDGSILYNCRVFNHKVRIAGPFSVQNDNQFRKLGNLIFEHMMRYPYYGKNTYWWFFYEPSYRTKETDDPFRINLAEIPYPMTIAEGMDRILMNLYRINSEFGYVYKLNQEMARAFFSESENEDKSFGFANIMIQLGYLTERKTLEIANGILYNEFITLKCESALSYRNFPA